MAQQEFQSQPARIDMLALEYRECNIGYNTRDVLVQDQFYKMVQTLSIFVTVLLGFRLLITTTLVLRFSFIGLMGVTGLLSLFAIMSDLQSNASCKIAIRRRVRRIEEALFENVEAGLWRALESRETYSEERMMKRMVKGNPRLDRDRHEPEKGVFVVAARLLIIAWIVIVGTVGLL